MGMQILALQFLKASARLLFNLNRVHWAYLTIFFVSAAAVLWSNYRRATTPILRQQLKWITRGTILAITPFTAFYVLPYLFGVMPSPAMKVSVLSLGLLPLTFGYAIFRYRLMDVDLIFKRGMAYTLAAAAIVGGLLRGGGRNCGTGAHPRAQFRAFRACGRGRGYRAALRSGSQVDSGKAGPVLLPHRLRLPPHADRIRTRAEFGDRPRQDAFFAGRPAGAHVAGRSHCDFPRQQRLVAIRIVEVVWHRARHRPRSVIPGEAANRGRGRTYLLRKHAPVAARKCRRAGGDCAPRSELLHSLPRAPEDHRLSRARQDHARRLPLQRRRGIARSTGGIHRHRDPERDALCFARTKGQRVRTAEGFQREHRRIDQRRRDGGRSAGPRSSPGTRRWK